MQVDKKKLERQLKGVDAWFDTSNNLINKHGAINYATGVGKTYTAMLIIKRLFRLDNLHNIVVIVPSEALQKQWTVEIAKHFTKKESIRIEIFTVNYIINNKLKVKTNTLVADELHEYLSDEYFKAINGHYIKFDNTLGLTATYEDQKKRHTKLLTYFPIVDKITEKEAIEEGYISPYIEFNLSVTLNEEEREGYLRYTEIISKTINKFGKGGISLASKCLGGGIDNKGIKREGKEFVYGWAVHKGWRADLDLSNPQSLQINDLWNPHKVLGYAQQLMNSIRLRKNILYNCFSKITIIREIVAKFEEPKTIIFSQSTAFADKLNLLLNQDNHNSSVVYHSSIQTIMRPSPKTGKLVKFGKTRLKKEAIDRITTGKSRMLCTASSLDKGLDIPDLSLGITASGTSNFTQYKQRKGRNIRLFGNDKIALLINLYVKGSQEEKWLKDRQSTTTHLIHWVDSVNEISYTPINKNEFTIDDM
jgi:superfamily II DNA or RNA helicase